MIIQKGIKNVLLLRVQASLWTAAINNNKDNKKGRTWEGKETSGLYANLKIKEIYFMTVKIQFNPNFDSSVYSSYKVRPYSHTPWAMNKTEFSLGKNNQRAALALHFCGGLEKKHGFSTVLKLTVTRFTMNCKLYSCFKLCSNKYQAITILFQTFWSQNS